jgi:hypothetical protein
MARLCREPMKIPNSDRAIIEPSKLTEYKFHLDVDVNVIKETAYGVRYEVSVNLLTPINRQLLVKIVWQIDTGTDFPRLITLVPD